MQTYILGFLDCLGNYGFAQPGSLLGERSRKPLKHIFSHLFPEQCTVMAQGPLIPTWLYKMVASMEAAIFNYQCDQTQNCEGGCETIYYATIRL